MIGALLTMSSKEVDCLEVIKDVIEKRIKQKDAADRLGVSSRHIRRLQKSYKQSGVEALVSKRRGKTSNRAFQAIFKNKVLECVKATYADFGPKLASEKLCERDGLIVSKETVRQWMIEANLWKGKKRKSVTTHPQRPRRTCLGELVQIDGSPHAWFESRGDECCLLVFIDDATSKIMQLHFLPAETTLGYFDATRKYIKQHGRPCAFYSDKHGIFRVNHKEAESGTGETQFGRAMRELGIELIYANTPQAKGRVERANSTLQDRLVKELRLENISDIESANAYVPEFLEQFNKRFAVPPMSPENAHRTACPDDETLSLIFSHQELRCLSKNLELSYNNIIYQINVKNKGYGLRNAKVTVCDNYQGSIKLVYKGRQLDYQIFDKANQVVEPVSSKDLNTKLDEVIKIDGRSKGHKPKAEHPWKQYKPHKKKKAA